MTFVGKLYVWSILLDPLFFFIFSQKNNLIGFPLSLSRILQFLVFLLLLSIFFQKIINKKKLIFINNFFPENQYLLLYLILSVFSLFIGVIFGSFNLSNKTDLQNLIDSPFYYRLLLEYAILLFNFIYFVILPSHLIKNKIDFNYFFRIFYFLLIVSLFAGYVDYLLTKFNIIDLFGRHIIDNVGVGDRFHGIGGEPRQYLAHAILNISMYVLYCRYFNFKVNKWLFSLLILTLPLTASGSLIFSYSIFLFFIIIFKFFKLYHILILIFLSTFVLLNERLIFYLENLLIILNILFFEEDIQLITRILRHEIYPIYNLVQKFQNHDFINLFFGHGIGSASVINNFYLDEYSGTANPNIQIVRLLYENGILGTIVFIISMIWPIKYYTCNTNKETRNLYLLTLFLVLSVALIVRSNVIFIYLGIMLSFLKFNEKKN